MPLPDTILSEQFRSAVLAEMDGTHGPESPAGAHVYGAFDWAGVGKVTKALDAVVVTMGPMIEAMTPAQYRDAVKMAATMLHALVGATGG